MLQNFYYQAHAHPIVLPPLNHQPITEINWVSAHQHFLQQQTQMYQQFFQLQMQLLDQKIETTPAQTQTQYYPNTFFSRTDLEKMAGGNIAPFFGEWFKPLDNYPRLIRMPEPPLLLADRVLGIAAEPGSMGTGTIWTETDVTTDSWYLHVGHMPAGVMIESGQADLLLASWLGFDQENKGQRVYRLLGCDLSFHGGLPKPGDTLHYQIKIDGHAKQGDVRLFFFHYDCWINGELRLKVRNGQAGFFTDEELSNSNGILWNPTDENLSSLPKPIQTKTMCNKKTLSHEDLKQLAKGSIYSCFGAGFEPTASHTRTPTISDGNMLFLHQIVEWDPNGGPQQRGYLRAEQILNPDDWFFKGHFKNDPCMPGTLMLEAGLQAMTCYLMLLGFTVDKDGWRFEPVTEQTYLMRCRGQAIPTSKKISYEIFVRSLSPDPVPTLHVDLLASVDGLKAFHTQIGLRLVPDWPLTTLPELQHPEYDSKPLCHYQDFKFDYASLIACALGQPSKAFGPLYQVFDGPRKVARLPGPPYHFMTRIVSIDGDMGQFKAGHKIVVEYDILPDSEYFYLSQPLMPLCALMETALQPCGWLASFMGSTLTSDQDFMFRNLDGTATLTNKILPLSGTIRTEIKCTNVSPSAGMIIESFEVTCFIGDEVIYSMQTVFGFFPPEAFENQTGLPIPDSEKIIFDQKNNCDHDPRHILNHYYQHHRWLMIDRITGFWPEQKQIRAEKMIRPDEWFFKAHFFQDPVQPGSLGIEALIQLLQSYMLLKKFDQLITNPYFEPLAFNEALTWKYRGQVTPANKIVTVMLTITHEEQQKDFALVRANGSLWVDGKRIYEAKNLSLRLCAGIQIDPEKETWLKDHHPTFTIPVLPMMSMIDCIAAEAQKHFPDQTLIRIEDARALQWVKLQQPVSIISRVKKLDEHKAYIELYQSQLFAKGTAIFAQTYPTPEEKISQDKNQLEMIENPYQNLCHGPAFEIMTQLEMGERFSIAYLDAAKRQAPFHYFNHLLLDGLLHGIPHEQLSTWCEKISSDQVGYPMLVSQLAFFSEEPKQGLVRCEAYFIGLLHQRFPQFKINLFHADGTLWASMMLTEALFTKSRLGNVPANIRRQFLQEKKYIPHLALSDYDEKTQTSSLAIETVQNTDWLPGSIACFYEINETDLEKLTQQVLIKEHFSRTQHQHPAKIKVDHHSYEITKIGNLFRIYSV